MLALPAALLACTSPIALAADANTADATTLDTIQVTAPIAKDTGTATKTDTPLLEVPQSISIITARDLQDRGLHAVDEAMRSEEHTSELQSLMRISYAVFCLKKKKKHSTIKDTRT